MCDLSSTGPHRAPFASPGHRFLLLLACLFGIRLSIACHVCSLCMVLSSQCQLVASLFLFGLYVWLWHSRHVSSCSGWRYALLIRSHHAAYVCFNFIFFVTGWCSPAIGCIYLTLCPSEINSGFSCCLGLYPCCPLCPVIQ